MAMDYKHSPSTVRCQLPPANAFAPLLKSLFLTGSTVFAKPFAGPMVGENGPETHTYPKIVVLAAQDLLLLLC
jgi:hypothetical protein